jgi:hypothetical protein
MVCLPCRRRRVPWREDGRCREGRQATSGKPLAGVLEIRPTRFSKKDGPSLREGLALGNARELLQLLTDAVQRLGSAKSLHELPDVKAPARAKGRSAEADMALRSERAAASTDAKKASSSLVAVLENALVTAARALERLACVGEPRASIRRDPDSEDLAGLVSVTSLSVVIKNVS